MTNATNAGFDLTNLLDTATSTTPATFKVPVIFDAAGEPTSGFIIVGKNSDEYRQAMHSIRVNSVVTSARRKTKLDTTTDEGATLFIQTIDTNEHVIALAITVGWYGFAMNGVEATFDKELVGKMFNKYATWEDQVLSALENDANFM